MKPRHLVRMAVAFMVLAGACSEDVGPDRTRSDPLQAFTNYVHAWPKGGAELMETITGPDAARLVSALQALRQGGVVATTLSDGTQVGSNPDELSGTVGLHFRDGGELEVTAHVTIEDERILAAPTAVSDELTEWATLHLEEYGSPRSGRISSNSGTRLAMGEFGKRVPVRPELAAAVELIDESLRTHLAGKVGRRLVAEAPRMVLATSAPSDGEDVATSLDDALQSAAEDVFGETAGALIAVDPESAGIRALVSNPQSGVPNVSPASSAYSPGSTFKLVTAAAALESSVVDIDTVVSCPAEMSLPERQIENFRGIGYGPISFKKAFSVSCNTAFARVGMTIGSDRLLRMASSLGIDVGPTVEPGGIAVPRSESELAVFSFGASGSLLTPLQIAGIGTAIARGGTWVAPGWTDEPTPGMRVLRTTTADDLVTMMEEVVTAGTGRNAAISGVQIAAKTGTAETEIGENVPTDAWFVALAPSRDATLAIVTFLPGGGLGGGHAAMLAHDFLETTIDIWNQG